MDSCTPGHLCWGQSHCCALEAEPVIWPICAQVIQHGETVTRVNKLEAAAKNLREAAQQAQAAAQAAQNAKVRNPKRACMHRQAGLCGTLMYCLAQDVLLA